MNCRENLIWKGQKTVLAGIVHTGIRPLMWTITSSWTEASLGPFLCLPLSTRPQYLFLQLVGPKGCGSMEIYWAVSPASSPSRSGSRRVPGFSFPSEVLQLLLCRFIHTRAPGSQGHTNPSTALRWAADLGSLQTVVKYSSWASTYKFEVMKMVDCSLHDVSELLPQAKDFKYLGILRS